jgi:hypothetical protein
MSAELHTTLQDLFDAAQRRAGTPNPPAVAVGGAGAAQDE